MGEIVAIDHSHIAPNSKRLLFCRPIGLPTEPLWSRKHEGSLSRVEAEWILSALPEVSLGLRADRSTLCADLPGGASLRHIAPAEVDLAGTVPPGMLDAFIGGEEHISGRPHRRKNQAAKQFRHTALTISTLPPLGKVCGIHPAHETAGLRGRSGWQPRFFYNTS